MSKYKVGDKVRIVKSDRDYSEDFTGQECFVVGVDESGVDLQITYECGDFNTLYFTNEEVEPVENKVTETKWTKWDGKGDMPVPKGTAINVEYRNGEITYAVAGEDRQGAYDWTHSKHPKDIVAYCVIPTEDNSKPEAYSYEELNSNFKKLVEQAPEAVTATDILQEAAECLTARAVERDKEGGERSMRAAVTAFNALTGHELSEVDGWNFMLMLKLARSYGGCFKLDDYVDAAAYAALAGESAGKQHDTGI